MAQFVLSNTTTEPTVDIVWVRGGGEGLWHKTETEILVWNYPQTFGVKLSPTFWCETQKHYGVFHNTQ